MQNKVIARWLPSSTYSEFALKCCFTSLCILVKRHCYLSAKKLTHQGRPREHYLIIYLFIISCVLHAWQFGKLYCTPVTIATFIRHKFEPEAGNARVCPALQMPMQCSCTCIASLFYCCEYGLSTII